MKYEISFIILSWNSEKFIEGCLLSIIKKCLEEQIRYEILIVDNGSKDSSVSIIKKYIADFKDNIHAIFLSTNKGTTYPRNLALQIAKGSTICILDSDTRFLSGNLRSILSLLEDTSIGIVAPMLLLPDGAIQNSVKKFPTLITKLSKLPKILFKLNLKDFDFYEAFPFTSIKYVDTAISACWFFRKEIINQVGFLDEKIFYSPEDIDFCIRIYQSNMSVVYFPNYKLLHITQQITHVRPFSHTSIKHLLGLFYYFKKHNCWITGPRYQENETYKIR